MSHDFNTRRKAILEKRLTELHEEYEAAYAQIGRTLNDADALKLKRQIAYLDEAIKEVEQQMAGLGQGRRGAGNSDDAAADYEQANTTHLVKLNDILNSRFNLSELNSLAFSLALDLDDLPGEGKRRKAEELVKYLNRHHRLAELITIGRKQRPDIDW